MLPGSGQVVGACDVEDSKPLTLEDMENNIDKHKITGVDVFWHIEYRNPHVWILKNAKRITPKKYNHPRGAVIWVKDVLTQPQAAKTDGQKLVEFCGMGCDPHARTKDL